MNLIDNIEIKNFKSIRHQKIEGCKRVNIFIGYPNVGKSNILEAISLGSSFQNSHTHISIKDICRFEELIGLFNDGDKDKVIEVKINDFFYTLSLFDNKTIQYGITHTDNYLADFVEINNYLADVKELDKFSKRLLINSDGSITAIGTNVRNSQPLVNIKKYQFLSSSNTNKNNPKTLDYPFGGNLFEVIRYNADLRKECGELFQMYDLKLAFDSNTNLKVQKQLDEFSLFQLPVIQVADTLQRLIFYKAAIQSNHSSVLIFEEPEAHMFPPYIKKLTTDIVFDKTNQFFLATHSPYVLDELILEAGEDLTVYLVDYENGETIIHNLSTNDLSEVRQYGVDLFFNIESYLKHGQVNNS